MNPPPALELDRQHLETIGQDPSVHAARGAADCEVEMEPVMTQRQHGMVDDRQDVLMARDSAEGRPPAHRRRVAEWKWFAVLGPLLLIAAVGFAINRGISIAGLALGMFLTLGYVMLAGWPTWGAGIMRGGEERDARKQATLDVHATDAPKKPPH